MFNYSSLLWLGSDRQWFNTSIYKNDIPSLERRRLFFTTAKSPSFPSDVPCCNSARGKFVTDLNSRVKLTKTLPCLQERNKTRLSCCGAFLRNFHLEGSGGGGGAGGGQNFSSKCIRNMRAGKAWPKVGGIYMEGRSEFITLTMPLNPLQNHIDGQFRVGQFTLVIMVI